MKNVFICTTDDFTREIIKNAVKKVFPKAQIFNDINDVQALYHLKYDEGNAIFFDRLYLSYVLQFKIGALRTLNKDNRIYFCEKGICPQFFGIRLLELKVDGFISGIEKIDEFIYKLKIISTGRTFFQDEVYACLKNKQLRKDERKACTEVTSLEYQIGILLGQGLQAKEISDNLGIKTGTILNHIHWLKKKIGFKNMSDFSILNNQIGKFNLRSCF